MSKWTSDELHKIGTAEELQIAPRRLDGTLRVPVTIWVIRIGGDLYIRSYRGPDGSWYRAAQRSHEGRIWVGGVEKEVAFLEVNDPLLNDQIDDAYRAKYGRYSQHVAPIVTSEERSTTLKLIPREKNT